MDFFDSFQEIVQALFPVMELEKIVIMLISGYLGYAVAYSGLPTKDTWAKILIFSLPCIILTNIFPAISRSFFFLHFFVSALFSMVLAGIWRRWGRLGVQKILRKFKISNEDGYESILNEMASRNDVEILSMLITMKNGNTLGTYLSSYQNQGFLNGTIDQYGNIRIYVMYKGHKDDGEKDYKPADPEYTEGTYKGYITITYIPKEEIEKIEYIVKKR